MKQKNKTIQELREDYIRALNPDCSTAKSNAYLADDLYNLDLTMYSENETFSSIIYNAFAQSHVDENISLHPEQIKILFQIENNDATIISDPTSCGKTFCIFEYIAKHKPQNVVLIVPTLALIEEYFKKIIKLYKDKFEEYRIHTGIDEDKTYDFSQKNIFILTHDRVVQEESYEKLEKIDFLVIDEVYKLKTDKNDRVLVLNMAYYYLSQKADKYVLLAPFIDDVDGKEKLEKQPSFYKTNYSPVVNEVIPCEIDNENDRFKKCEEILYNDINDADKTLIYFPTVRSLYQYVNEVLIHKPKWSSPPKYIATFLKWAKEEIHEEWCVVKALERGYLIHNGQIPLGVRVFQLDRYGDMDLYNRMLCTSTLLEGVNTTAKNIIIIKPSNGTNKEGESFTAFDFYNLVGRTGRLRKHYVGNAYYIKSPYDPDFLKSDATIKIQFEINDESKDIDIQKGEIDKHKDVNDFLETLGIDIEKYKEFIGTKARFETVKNLYHNYCNYKKLLIQSLIKIIEHPTTTSKFEIVNVVYAIIYGKENKYKASLITKLIDQRRLKVKDIIKDTLKYSSQSVDEIISEIIRLKNSIIEHTFYNQSTIIKFFMQIDQINNKLINVFNKKILESIEILYFSNEKQEKMLLELGIYEYDIPKIIRIIGNSFDDAFELKNILAKNLNNIQSNPSITFLSKYIIEQLL